MDDTDAWQPLLLGTTHGRGGHANAERRGQRATPPQGPEPGTVLVALTYDVTGPFPKGDPTRIGRELARSPVQSRHSIICSARLRTASGICRPSALAVLRLMANSKVVGCSTGMSAGCAPRNSRAT